MPTPYITKTFYCSTIHSYLNNFTLITKKYQSFLSYALANYQT